MYNFHRWILFAVRHYSRISIPVIRVSNNVAYLGCPKEEPKPRQLLWLPPFPSHPLPGKNSLAVSGNPNRVTAITWIKYYFHEIHHSVIQSHFNKGLVQKECPHLDDSLSEKDGQMKPTRKIKHNEVMEAGARVCIPVSVAEARISKRFDTIPSGTLYPNADEIAYLQRLVKYKDSAIIVLNKPPKLPVKC